MTDSPQLSDSLDVDALDRDGALGETLARFTSTRRHSLATGLAGILTLAAVGSASAQSAPNDDDVLNFALSLEYLQAAFYTETERVGAIDATGSRAVEVIGAVERAHVEALKGALGQKAVRRPTFDFQGTTEDNALFLKTAVALEDLGTAAYKAGLPLLRRPQIIATAAAVHTVEARHAAWIRYLAGTNPAVNALDDPKSVAATLALVADTKFVVERPTTRSRRRPNFTG